jgi:hypothetical protein
METETDEKLTAHQLESINPPVRQRRNFTKTGSTSTMTESLSDLILKDYEMRIVMQMLGISKLSV